MREYGPSKLETKICVTLHSHRKGTRRRIRGLDQSMLAATRLAFLDVFITWRIVVLSLIDLPAMPPFLSWTFTQLFENFLPSF